MKIIRKGCTRIVILICNIAIKIPNFTVCHRHFLYGCYANYSERNYCKMFRGMTKFYNLVAPSLFCSWFGIIQIQQRCEPIDFDLSDEQLELLKIVHNGDEKKENFGYYKNRLVCLDYA